MTSISPSYLLHMCPQGIVMPTAAMGQYFTLCTPEKTGVEAWQSLWVVRAGGPMIKNGAIPKSGCFWRNPAVAAVNGSGTCGSSRSVAGAACHGHASCSSGRSGSCSKMAAFYSEETAALVTEYSQADLDRYDYPAWSPSADKPLPEGCTGEVETSLDPLIGGSP